MRASRSGASTSREGNRLLRPRVPSTDGDHFAFFRGAFRRLESWCLVFSPLSERSKHPGDKCQRIAVHANVLSHTMTVLSRVLDTLGGFCFRLVNEECPFVGSSFTAGAAISLLPTRPPSSLSLRVAIVEVDTSHRLLQEQRHPSTTLELRSLRVGRSQSSHLEPTRLGFSCENEGVCRQTKPLTKQASNGIPPCGVGRLSLRRHPSHQRFWRRYRWP